MACLISLFPSFSVYRTYVLVWPAIYCATKHCHITPLFKKLHWLRVRLRVTFKILLLTFKVLHQIGPSYMSDLISITLPDSYNLRLVPTMAPSVFPILAFMFADPQLWNNLPADIRNIDNLSNFKSKLKTHHFIIAFS